ncbi:cytochrome P450 [Phascolomyces articulosus]|uniref:Cytochrome P450 n=1 Tax=Phascolomyces articulosus TaxID=60185 RepID=A0AAD5K0S1_9FUNG|nr:cytochrome P450 [Phascolomyces articulosus]
MRAILHQNVENTFKKIVSNTTRRGVTLVTLGVTACVYLLISSMKNKDIDKKTGLKKLPSPKGAIPYFGHLLMLDEVPVNQFTKWHNELGPLFTVRMGVKQWVCVSEPYLAHQIFGVHGRYTSARPHTTYLCDYYALGRKGIVAGNPSLQWKKTRGATIQALSPKNRPHLDKLVIPEAEEVVEKLLTITTQKGSVNVADPLHFLSLNVILSTCFGKRVTSTDDPLFLEITSIMREGGKRASPAEEINTFLPIMTLFDMITGKKQKLDQFIVEQRDPAFGRLIQEARENNVDCLSNTLFESKDVNEYNNVLVALADAILAGTDTTAVMLEWSLMILCHYPKVQKIIRDEIDQFIRTNERLPTFEERESIPYSLSVQKECMRYKPTTFFGVPHESTQGFEVNGYFIPKGASVVCNMHAIHRDPTFYPEADKFLPERFLGDLKPMYISANLNVNARDTFNFGFGRRVCPGAYLAELEIFNVWTRLFSQCVIEPALDKDGIPVFPDLDALINAGIVTPPASPVMRIVKRVDSLL